MRLVYTVFILLMLSVISAQCQQTADDRFDKGVALDGQGKYDDAIKAYDEAIRINPNFVEAWYNKGLALLNQGKYDEAVEAYNQVIRINPNFVGAWDDKGNALCSQGKYDEAIKAYDEAIRIDPSFSTAWSNKGIASITWADTMRPSKRAPRPSG